MQCDGKTCYDEILRTKTICKPSYNNAGQDYLSVIPVGKNYIFIIVVMTWLSVVLLSILEVLLFNKINIITNCDDKLALGFAALMFSGGLLYLYIDKFNHNTFCLMNKNDPLCKDFNVTSCFAQESNSVFGDNFGFGGFLEIGSEFGFHFRKTP